MKYIIYKPTRTSMQSGVAKTREWLLECENKGEGYIYPITGWNSQEHTYAQIKLWFDSLEQAEKYAKKKKLSYEIIQPTLYAPKPKSYKDNFLK